MRMVVKCKTAIEGTIKKQPPRPGVEIRATQLLVAGTNSDSLPVAHKDNNPAAIAFVPCYRLLMVERVIPGELVSDHWSAEPLSAVTTCETHEGCFHLTFPKGLLYTDDKEPPTAAELAQGELEETSENRLVTDAGAGQTKVDYGSGLKRNDHGTWGVCLPKTKTVRESAYRKPK